MVYQSYIDIRRCLTSRYHQITHCIIIYNTYILICATYHLSHNLITYCTYTILNIHNVSIDMLHKCCGVIVWIIWSVRQNIYSTLLGSEQVYNFNHQLLQWYYSMNKYNIWLIYTPFVHHIYYTQQSTTIAYVRIRTQCTSNSVVLLRCQWHLISTYNVFQQWSTTFCPPVDV